jgi:hypothetical protein
MTAGIIVIALLMGFAAMMGSAMWMCRRMANIERAVRCAKRLHGQNQRALEEIAGKLDAIAGTCSGQPAQLLESAAHLRGAVDEMRWQYNNRELLLNDQLELLAQQARALARLRYEAISMPGDFAGDGAGHAAAAPAGRPWREDSAQPVAQASGLSVHSRGRHADAKVVTLKEHLRQF